MHVVSRFNTTNVSFNQMYFFSTHMTLTEYFCQEKTKINIILKNIETLVNKTEK